MKLSKRFAAALIALCMLLTVMPSFAATVTKPNSSITLPTDGTKIELVSSSTGIGNKCLGLVVTTASAEALGIDLSSITSRTLTEGSEYDGLMLDVKFEIKDYTYDPNSTTEDDKIFAYGELTEFELKGIEVTAVRKSSGGALVLDLLVADFPAALVSGSVKRLAEGKITGEETEPVTFTADDFVTLTTEQEAALSFGPDRLTDGVHNGYDFAGTGGNGHNITIEAYAGDDYNAGTSIDTGIFPEGTIFLSANAMGSTNGTAAGLAFTGNSATGHLMAGIYVAQATETYAVYGLRTVYNSGSNNSRGAAAYINGVSHKFDKYTTTAKEDWMGAPSWMWDASSETVTLDKGDLLTVEQYKHDTYDRLAAIALVPTSALDEMNKTENWERDAANIPDQATLDLAYAITATPFVAPDPVNATVKVNGTDYEVSSVEADSTIAVSYTDFDGSIVKNVTVMDALVKAGLVTADNKDTFNAAINVKLNGTTITAYDKWTLYGGEEITATFPETVDVTNFSPVKLSDVLSTQGGSDSGMKICFTVTSSLKTSAISFIHDGTDYVDDALKDAKVNGYAISTEDITKSYTDGDLSGTTVVIPKGGRVYFDNAYFNGKVLRSGTYGLQLYGVGHANAGTTPLHVTLPDGTITTNPYKLQQSGYEYSHVYITNSNTTNELKTRYIEEDNKWQLYIDGGKHVCVVKYAVDGDGKLSSVISTEEAFITVSEPFSITLKDNEKAVVWGYKPYEGVGTGGTTMVPLTDVLTVPAK